MTPIRPMNIKTDKRGESKGDLSGVEVETTAMAVTRKWPTSPWAAPAIPLV